VDKPSPGAGGRCAHHGAPERVARQRQRGPYGRGDIGDGLRIVPGVTLNVGAWHLCLDRADGGASAVAILLVEAFGM
jgi:hypothetical protein